MKTSISDYAPPAAPTRRRRPAAAAPRRLPRARPARPAAAAVREPHWSEVPDWSEATLEKLAVLTPLEQAVATWRIAGYSGAESYRRATGKDAHSARQSANQILRRPEVAAAVEAGLRDRNFAARLDLEWFLQKLHWVVVNCEDEGTPAHMNALCNAIKVMAKLQGEWPGSRRPPRRPVSQGTEPEPESPGMRRVREILADCDRRAAAAKAAAAEGTAGSLPIEHAESVEDGHEVLPAPSNRLDQLVTRGAAVATRARHRPAVVDPLAVAPSATLSPDQAPPPAATPAIMSTTDNPSPGAAPPVAATPASVWDGVPSSVLRLPSLNPRRRPAAPEPIPDEPAPPKWLVPANWAGWDRCIVETRFPRTY